MRLLDIARSKGYCTHEGSNNLVPTFNALWKVCNVHSSQATMRFGGKTYTYMQGNSGVLDTCNGMVTYIKSKGVMCKYNTKTGGDVTFDWLKIQINSGYPCALFYKNSDDNQIGHCITVSGYYIYKNGDKFNNHLYVSDGYNWNKRYLLLDSIKPELRSGAASLNIYK